MSDVPGYHPLRTLGKLSSACRKLELIEWEMRTLDSSKIEEALKRGNHSLSNEKSVSSLRHYWAWAHKSAKLLGSRRGPSNPQMGHSSAPVMHFQQRVQPG